MSDIYKTAFALTIEGKLQSQLMEAVSTLRIFHKEIAETQGRLNKLRLGGGLFESVGKFATDIKALRGVSAEVAGVMNREFKGAFAGINSEVAGLRRSLSELQGQMRGMGGGGGRSIRYGGGGHGGGGLLDTIAMGPQHSGVYAGLNVEHGLVGGLLHANGELQRQLNLYRLGGAKPSDVAAARSAAFRSAVMVPDVGVAEQMKLLRELSGATGDEAGARMMLPQVAKTKSIMEAVTGRSSEEDMKRLFKFIELRGVAIDEATHKIDVSKFGGELNYATKAMVAAQGLITSNDMLAFTKQAGSMAKGMSGEDLFTTMLAGIEDMGGSRAGTSLSAVGRQFLGGVMTGGKAGRLKELGLLNASGTETTDAGGIKITDPTKAIVGYDVLTKSGFGAFMEQVIRPHMQEHGITGRQQQNEELYRSVGTDTARRLMGLYLSGHEQVGIVADRYRKAMAGGEGYDKIFGSGQDLQTSTKALSEAFTTLKTALGDAPAVSASMMSLARGIAGLADMVKDHPALGTAATLGGVGASASLLGFGAVQTMRGFGLPAAATQLSAAAVALDAAAAKIGGASIAADVAKTAATGGVLAGLGLTGITAGTIAAGAFAGYATGQTLPGIARKEGPGAIDPATGEHLDTAIPQTTPWLRNWIQSWFSSPEAKTAGETVGKQSALATTDGFKTGPFEPAGAAAAMGLLRGFLTAMSGSGVQPASFGGGGLGGLIQKASLGGGGLGSGIGGNGIVPPGMTGSDANLLGLISKYESGGRNTMNYIGDRTHTAQGYYQITNSNWRKIAPRLGITAPNAMSASLADQARVAQVLLHNGKGIRNWSDYNPRLRGALGRGERYNPVTQQMPTAGPPPQKREVVVHTALHVDGRKMASAVTRHQSDSMRFPGSVGAMDGHGSWRPPGTDAAHAA
ncbi:hypothetical protein MKK69_19450 [Methylobacterium sp. J-026]|uniref:hypothetical protein n=1 Tax=Methylobacterium sp. J-026 TaxID=2836624 RepID=UPI001FBB8037|nr:hypothetical protein [Methylobacterium sp. J-026]MCJ2136200.1 hypothetical protein [Methylobacterium sp. J-026]